MLRALAIFLIWSVVHTASAAADLVSPGERLNLFEEAYAGAIAALDETHVTLKSGKKILIDDGLRKSHQNRLTNADLEDMLSQIYPTITCMSIDEKPVRNFDPGRIRNDTFMKAVFGQSAKEVRKELVTIDWFGQKLQVTRRLGVADALKRVEADLRRIKELDTSFVRNMGGTFNWRRIAGTKRMSVHSFAAAVDLNTKKADYWRWSGGKPGNVPKYKNRVPANIVAAFEKHGFIWGGRWYHYDTMHFEYRPAIMAIARLAEQRGCAK